MGFQPNWLEVQPEHKWKILTKQKRFLLWALYSSIGSMMLGFDYGIAGTATAFPAFQQDFGEPWPSQPSGYLIPARVQAGWAGASAGGDVVGVLIAGQLLEIIGRKHTVAVGSVVTAIGVGMQVGSHEWKLFLIGRLINAIGFGIVFLESPVWIGENCRPELRGFFLCIMNGSIVLGQFLLSCAAQGTSTVTGKWSYMTLLVLQFVYVVILLAIYPFYPESPYYLIKRGKHEKARRALNRIHGSGDQVLIDAEIKRLQSNIDFSEQIKQSAQQKGPLFVQCFQGTNLKRSIIAMLPAAGQQLIGAAFVLGYITYFLSLLKVSDYFTVSAILFTVMLLSNIAAFFVIEIVGRRTLLVPGIVALTVVLLVMGIMGCINAPGALWVIVVCIFLWAITYQLTIGAAGFAIGSEIASLPLRPSTQSLIGATQGSIGWLIGFISPYMINPDAGNLGAKVGFVFAGLGVPLCVAFYFLIPETKGLSFDEMDYLFTNKVSCRRFQSAIKRQRAESGNQLVVETSGGVVKTEGTAVTEVEQKSLGSV